MDSFYDQPRKAPMPSGLSSSSKGIPLIQSAVPDASLLLQNKGNIPQKKSEMSYNAWKYQLRGPQKSSINKENTQPESDSIFRKQVRFETPQTINIRPHIPNFNVQPTRPTLVNRQLNPTIKYPEPQQPPPKQLESEQFGMPRNSVENKILQAKPFEKIYMANVPNRNLDLSIIEHPRNIQLQQLQRSNSAPERFQNILPPQNHNQINQKVFYNEQYNDRRPVAESTTLEVKKVDAILNKQLVPKTDDEPSVKDLLKIIQQQNEQLMCLQQQVSTLLKERSQQPQIEAANKENWQQPVFKNKILDNVLQNQAQNLSQRGGVGNKFAIDVMTSFEVSIRAPNGNFGRNRKSNDDYEKARITEILNESSKNSKTDMSIKLDEPVVVNERCPSPENSIHVDMKDFSSDEEADGNNDLDTSMIGWTIYNNVMDQVNFMLKKSTTPTNQPITNQNQQVTGVIMKQVKEATLKHLQRAGVDLNNLDDDITISTEADYTPTQVSFAVKQLLMKYLPDDHLTKLATHNQKQQKFAVQNTEVQNGDYPKNLIKRRPDFSMATVQYMEKYNLLNRDSGTNPRNVNSKNAAPVVPINNKMLDITALKQQPKLL